MSAKVSELVVPTEAVYLELIGQYVCFVALQMGFPEREVARIRLAVDEACANVVLHAAAEGGFDSFRVVCEQSDGSLTVRVQDAGPPFDLDQMSDPQLDVPLEQRRAGGLGIYLMRRVMDSVELRPRPDGKEIVLVKVLPGLEGASDGD